MNEDIVATINECTRRSDENSIPFPEVVGKLIRVGVERYHADLCRSEKVHFLASGEAHVDRFRTPNQAITAEFSAQAVEQAVRAVQRGELTYFAFLTEIMAAGCCDYFVFIRGKRVVYMGREGACFVEPFPAAS